MCHICKQDKCPSACPNSEYKSVAICNVCGQDILSYEDYYQHEGNDICADCLEEYGKQNFKKIEGEN